jgi:hypothetical protein
MPTFCDSTKYWWSGLPDFTMSPFVKGGLNCDGRAKSYFLLPSQGRAGVGLALADYCQPRFALTKSQLINLSMKAAK